MEKETPPILTTDAYADAMAHWDAEVEPLWREVAESEAKLNELKVRLANTEKIEEPKEVSSIVEYVGYPVFFILGYGMAVAVLYLLISFVIDIENYLIVTGLINQIADTELMAFELWSAVTLSLAAIVGLIRFLSWKVDSAKYDKRFEAFWESESRKIELELAEEEERFAERRAALDRVLPAEILKLREELSDDDLASHIDDADPLFARQIALLDELGEIERLREKTIRERYESLPPEVIKETNGLLPKDYNEPEPEFFGKYIGTVMKICFGPFALAFIADCFHWLFSDDKDFGIMSKIGFSISLVLTVVVFFFMLIIYLCRRDDWKKERETFYENIGRRDMLAYAEGVEHQLFISRRESKGKLEARRARLLHTLFTTNLALPMRKVEKSNFDKMLQLYRHLSTAARKMPHIEYFNEKLKAFYSTSLKLEADNNKELYAPFEEIAKTFAPMEMRKRISHPEATLESVTKFEQHIRSFNVDRYIDPFTEMMSMDTSGTFCEHDRKKVETKTKGMQEIYNSFVKEVNRFGSRTAKSVKALGISRMIAYRNLYLGAEIINVIRENGGGGKLIRTADTVATETIGLSNVASVQALSMKDISIGVLDDTLGAVAVCVDEVLNDKAAMKYYKKNPKEALVTAAGVAAVAAINSAIEAWDNRNKEIAANLRLQEQLIEDIDNVFQKYLDYEASFNRIIELSRALIKTNEGFMAVYEPLRDMVFHEKRSAEVSIQQLQQLVLAINDYKKISDTAI